MVTVRVLLPVLLFAVLVCSAVQAVSIGEAKFLSDGTPVVVQGVICFADPSDGLYVEAEDRSSGIFVEKTGIIPAENVRVIVNGIMATSDSGERYIVPDNIGMMGAASVAPLAMLNRNLGGSPLGLQPGPDDCRPVSVPAGNGWTQGWQWFPAVGVNNVGLLVRTWGKVKAVSQSATNGVKWFHIDDGSHVVSDLGDWGVLVYSDAPVKQGDQVAVTGISGLEPAIDNPEKMIRVLRTRSADDVQVTKQAEVLTRPFSDEFNSPVLDPRWAYNRRCGSISVTSNPGSVRLVMPGYGSAAPGCENIIGPELIQPLGGSWQIDVKLRADFSTNPEAHQRFGVQLRDWLFDVPKRDWYGYPHWPPPPEYLAYIAIYNGQAGVYPSPESGGSGPFQPGDPVYFRFIMTGLSVSVESSLNGVFTGHPEHVVYVKYDGYGPYLAITMFSDDPGPASKPFSAYCDYFRLTSMGQ